MKSVQRVMSIWVLLLCGLVAAFGQAVDVTLLHMNDTHSHLDSWGPKDASLHGTLGGIAKAATVIGTIRATEPNVLLLHAGDSFQGDPIFNAYFSVPEFQLLNAIGLDAMAVGNHEFAFGPDALAYVLSTALPSGGYPFLSANLDLTGYPALGNWIQPSVMKTYGTAKVGVFGLTIPHEPTENPDPVVIQDNIFDIAAATAQSLRSQGAGAVVCLSHLGSYLDKLLAANVPGIDFIVGGHDHYLFDQPIAVQNPAGGTTYIFQAGQFYDHVGELKFSIDNGVVTMKSYRAIPVDAGVTADPTLQAMVEEIKAGVEQKFGPIYHEVVATAPHDIDKSFETKTPLRDTPFGNLVTDAYREYTGTEIAVNAIGLVSEKLYKGKILAADVFRALANGYDPATGLGFTLATCTISGAELIKGMEFGLSELGITDDVFLQYSGMRFKYNPTKPVGQRVIIPSITVHDKKFNPLANYTLTVNSGAVMLFGLIGVSVENLTMLPAFEYNVVKDFIAARHEISYNAQGRIREVKGSDESAPVVQAVSSQALALGNSPNPFNPATTIHFELPADGSVRMVIFNALGQIVDILQDGAAVSGPHDLHWNSNGRASGIYFYGLYYTPGDASVAPVVKFGKMILAK